jgi:hypothetical protein
LTLHQTLRSSILAIGLVLLSLLPFLEQAEARSISPPFTISSPKLENPIESSSDFKMVTVNFTNTTPHDSSYAVFLEARTKNGVTEYLEFHTGVVDAFERLTLASSWHAPEDLARYELRAFAITNFTSPVVLTEVKTTDLALEPISFS